MVEWRCAQQGARSLVSLASEVIHQELDKLTLKHSTGSEVAEVLKVEEERKEDAVEGFVTKYCRAIIKVRWTRVLGNTRGIGEEDREGEREIL